MSVVLRQLLTTFALLACAMALLPPAGFALCVDADGHLVVEAGNAGRGMCCLPGAGAEAGESCQPDACGTCVDYALSAGDALRSGGMAGAMPDPPLAHPALNGESPIRLSARVAVVRAAAARAPGACAPTPLRL